MQSEIPQALLSQLSSLLHRNKLSIIEYRKNEMGEWYLSTENDAYTVIISSDRGGREHVEIQTKIRAKKGAPLRTWSIGHLRGYLEGGDEHYVFNSLAEQLQWLEPRESELFDNALLNSDDLRRWSSAAARKFLG